MRKFCSGITQDFDVTFSSMEGLVQFCSGSLSLDERKLVREGVSEIIDKPAQEQLAFWNGLFSDIYFKKAKNAARFSTELNKVLQKDASGLE